VQPEEVHLGVGGVRCEQRAAIRRDGHPRGAVSQPQLRRAFRGPRLLSTPAAHASLRRPPASPRRELLASPSELLASPRELLASPRNLLTSPSELLASPFRQSGAGAGHRGRTHSPCTAATHRPRATAAWPPCGRARRWGGGGGWWRPRRRPAAPSAPRCWRSPRRTGAPHPPTW
jgi:hypothetical protein